MPLVDNSLRKLVKLINYSEPLEMLACVARIAGNKAVMGIPATQVQAHLKGQRECPTPA